MMEPETSSVSARSESVALHSMGVSLSNVMRFFWTGVFQNRFFKRNLRFFMGFLYNLRLVKNCNVSFKCGFSGSYCNLFYCI